MIKINISTDDTLSNEEIEKLLQTVRDIEQNKPNRHISVWIDAPDKSVKEMKDMMNSVGPALPYKTVIELDRKKDM